MEGQDIVNIEIDEAFKEDLNMIACTLIDAREDCLTLRGQKKNRGHMYAVFVIDEILKKIEGAVAKIDKVREKGEL